MILKNLALLASRRLQGTCDWCGKWCRKREPLHIFSRGAGTVDAPWNVLAVGRTIDWECKCHSRNHSGEEPTTQQLIDLSAKKHGTTPKAIEESVWVIRRLPKQPSLTDLIRALRGHGREVKKLVNSVVKVRV